MQYHSSSIARQHRVPLMEKVEIEQLGASLRPIDRKLLNSRSEQGRIRIWYQGGEPYLDLFIELQNDRIQWFQFTLRGRSLSWQKRRNGLETKDSWQTGVTNELQFNDLNFYAASKTIQSDRQTDAAFLELARAIFQTRAGEKLFDRLLAIFENIEN